MSKEYDDDFDDDDDESDSFEALRKRTEDMTGGKPIMFSSCATRSSSPPIPTKSTGNSISDSPRKVQPERSSIGWKEEWEKSVGESDGAGKKSVESNGHSGGFGGDDDDDDDDDDDSEWERLMERSKNIIPKRTPIDIEEPTPTSTTTVPSRQPAHVRFESPPQHKNDVALDSSGIHWDDDDDDILEISGDTSPVALKSPRQKPMDEDTKKSPIVSRQPQVAPTVRSRQVPSVEVNVGGGSGQPDTNRHGQAQKQLGMTAAVDNGKAVAAGGANDRQRKDKAGHPAEGSTQPVTNVQDDGGPSAAFHAAKSAVPHTRRDHADSWQSQTHAGVNSDTHTLSTPHGHTDPVSDTHDRAGDVGDKHAERTLHADTHTRGHTQAQTQTQQPPQGGSRIDTHVLNSAAHTHPGTNATLRLPQGNGRRDSFNAVDTARLRERVIRERAGVSRSEQPHQHTHANAAHQPIHRCPYEPPHACPHAPHPNTGQHLYSQPRSHIHTPAHAHTHTGAPVYVAGRDVAQQMRSGGWPHAGVDASEKILQDTLVDVVLSMLTSQDTTTRLNAVKLAFGENGNQPSPLAGDFGGFPTSTGAHTNINLLQSLEDDEDDLVFPQIRCGACRTRKMLRKEILRRPEYCQFTPTTVDTCILEAVEEMFSDRQVVNLLRSRVVDKLRGEHGQPL